MKNKTALTDAGHLLDMVHATRVGTVVCIKSFGCYDEFLGGVILRAGKDYIAADHRLAQRFPANFAPVGR
jgi:hypothetical protein